ncbi:hypothetical protein SNEBB_011001 [Seison nebaliae]|nr:hypothetical protein SNEBB_011001 [Seison nebaliae]
MAYGRGETEGCAKCIKILIMLINFIFMLASSAILLAGVLLFIGQDSLGIFKKVGLDIFGLASKAQEIIKHLSIAILVIGAVATVLCIMGCGAACCENGGYLICYGFMSLLAGVGAIVFMFQALKWLKKPGLSKIEVLKKIVPILFGTYAGLCFFCFILAIGLGCYLIKEA